MDKKISSLVPTIIMIVFIGLILSIVRTSIFSHVEEEKHIYFEIVFLLLLAVAGELVVLYLRLPSVMILMILGIFLSHSFIETFWTFLNSLNLSFIPRESPDIIRLESIIHVFSQLGGVILLFKVGLHNKIERIFSKENIVVASLGVIFPFLVGFLYASLTGGNFAYSMFLGAALTATSVGVSVAILKEAKLIEEKFAQIIIGAAIIDDILGLLVLSIVLNVTGGEVTIEPIVITVISAAVFIAGAILAGNKIIEYLDKKELSTRRFLLVLCVMLFYAYIAEFIKLSAIVGAFIAGVILNRSKHLHEIEEKTYGLEMLFMPIFFISLGTLVEIDAIFEFSIPILVISSIALLSKIIPCAIGSLISKISMKESLLIGVGMAPRGEVALIVAALGLSAGILSGAQYSIISAMALLTTFAVPPILTHLLKADTAVQIKN